MLLRSAAARSRSDLLMNRAGGAEAGLSSPEYGWFGEVVHHQLSRRLSILPSGSSRENPGRTLGLIPGASRIANAAVYAFGLRMNESSFALNSGKAVAILAAIVTSPVTTARANALTATSFRKCTGHVSLSAASSNIAIGISS